MTVVVGVAVSVGISVAVHVRLSVDVGTGVTVGLELRVDVQVGVIVSVLVGVGVAVAKSGRSTYLDADVGLTMRAMAEQQYATVPFPFLWEIHGKSYIYPPPQQRSMPQIAETAAGACGTNTQDTVTKGIGALCSIPHVAQPKCTGSTLNPTSHTANTPGLSVIQRVHCLSRSWNALLVWTLHRFRSLLSFTPPIKAHSPSPSSPSAPFSEPGGGAMHWKGGGTPPPKAAQTMPSHCLPDAKCQLQWHL